MDASQLQQYQTLMSNPATTTPQTSGVSSAGMVNFFNSPIYGMLYGQQGATSNATAAQNGTYNPVTAFQNSDPSYQYQINQALENVNNMGAAKGLLESTNTQNNLLNTSQNLQNQQYQNWLGQQNSLFSNYQNQLYGLANQGAVNTQATSSNSANQNLASLLAQLTSSTGSQLSSNSQNTGQTISQILANQGVLNANAYLGLGAGLSNNIFQGNTFTAQTQAQQSAQAAQNASNRNNLQSFTTGQTGLF